MSSLSPIDRFLNSLSYNGKKYYPTRDGYKCQCPAHDDRKPSMDIKVGTKGQIVFKCWTGCEKQEVLDCLDLTWSELYPDHDPDAKFKIPKPDLFHEKVLIDIYQETAKKRPLTEKELDRIELGMKRINFVEAS